MKTLIKILFVALLFTSFSTAAHSQQTLFNSLNRRMAILYKNGKILEAIATANDVVKVAAKTFGTNNAYYSSSLENLALLYFTESNFKKAESLYNQSLKIRENLLGKDHPRLINVLEKLEKCYKQLGQTAKVKMTEDRIESIQAKS